MDIVDKLRAAKDFHTHYEAAADTIEALRTQLASAQAEKAELVKRCADIVRMQSQETSCKRAAEKILALIPKDNQEVNKC